MNCNEQGVLLRLKALAYPFSDPPPNLSDVAELQRIIIWLEDSHIRRLTVPERKMLNDASCPFAPALRHYLRLLTGDTVALSSFRARAPAPPVRGDATSLRPCTLWLLDLALHLSYTDAAVTYNTPIDPWDGLYVDPRTSITAEDVPALTQLLTALGVHPDHLTAADGTTGDARNDQLLNVAADIIEYNARFKDFHPGEHVVVPTLEELPLGFDVHGRTDLNNFAKVLRLLHMKQLRVLQDDINEALTKMQSVTANPKTNSKLGKVGR